MAQGHSSHSTFGAGSDVHCVMPPAPELERRILATKELLEEGRDFAEAGEDALNPRQFALITGRPARTRPNTFVDAKPDVGTRRRDAAGARAPR